jgi:hypothetical protein
MVMVIAIILAIISAVLYRAGGMSKEPTAKPRWIPVWLRKSWVRDWLCPLCSIGTLLLFWKPTNAFGFEMILLSYGLMGGMLSTYWDFLFGYDNYWFHGFGVGLSIFPLIFAGYTWWIVLLHAVVMAILVGGLSVLIKKDWLEEMSRGFVISILRTIYG